MSKSWYVFKAPWKKGATPVVTVHYQPIDFQMQQYAVKYGPVVVLDTEALAEKNKQV